MTRYGESFIEFGIDTRLVGLAVAFDYKEKELVLVIGPISMVIRFTEFNHGPWIKFNNK